jgi:hypothetical protein
LKKTELSDDALKKLIVRQQRAIAAGKKGYKLSDTLTDQLSLHLAEGRAVEMGNGRVARLKDKFLTATRVGYGGAVRRYEVEVEDGGDVKL